MMVKVNLRQKLALFDEHWKPKVVGELNGQMVKLVKFQGEFVWHHHDDEDELFHRTNGRCGAWRASETRAAPMRRACTISLAAILRPCQ
jgi:hypothetical protein